jgi:hypothetical protein
MAFELLPVLAEETYRTLLVLADVLESFKSSNVPLVKDDDDIVSAVPVVSVFQVQVWA